MLEIAQYFTIIFSEISEIGAYMFSSFGSLIHSMKLCLSAEYAKQHKEQEIVSEITMLTQKVGNTDKIKTLLHELSGSTLEALTTIFVENQYFEYNNLGVQLDPSKATIAIDNAMTMAREHAELCGHGDRAGWAAKRIMFAHQWAVMGKVLTSSLEKEIRTIAQKIVWAKNGYMERDVQNYLTKNGIFQ